MTPGARLTYTLDFGSLGPDPVPQGEVWDGLPGWVDYITSTGGTYSETAHAVAWELSDLISGFVGSATIVVQVSEPITAGAEVCNYAQFLAVDGDAPPDPNPDNNDDTACTTIETLQTFYYVYLPIVVKSTP